MATKNCVIQGETEEHSRMFWNGIGWTGEYPEAQLYTAGEALRFTRTTSFDVPVFIVADYGTADEVVVVR